MSPFTRAQYIDAITNALSYLKSQVELNSAINKYSINIEAEDFYAGFLNVVFGLRLKNANHAEKNIASIDLYEECGSDDGQRVAVQVTSKNDAAKIKKTLESFSKYEYQKDYTRLIILMITTKKEYRTEFSFTGESKIEFEPKRDILDVKDLLNQINSITDTDHLRSIYEYLNKELPPAILSLDGKGDTNRDRSNDNELFSRLMIIFSNDRKIHPSIRMMDPDPNLFPKGLPEIKSDNRLAVVDQKSPRAIKNMILDSWKRDDKRHILLISIADATVEKMNDVVESAQAATEKMAQISEKLRNDVNNMHDINASIADVSSVVDNNSATSEETAAVSEEQKAQVDTMVSIMESFSI